MSCLCELSYSLQANTFCESERSNWIHLEIKKKQERIKLSLPANTFCESERSNWIHLEIKKNRKDNYRGEGGWCLSQGVIATI